MENNIYDKIYNNIYDKINLYNNLILLLRKVFDLIPKKNYKNLDL